MRFFGGMQKSPPSTIDRAAGSIVGAFVGDALGVGPHWYYDLKELRARYGWITGYTTPYPGHYHDGMHRGDLSQTGLIMEMLLSSLADRGGYDEGDFCQRLDGLLAQLDGDARSGPGGYTNHSIRQVWQARIQERKPWGQVAGNADTSEGAERVALLAARYALQPGELAQQAASCVRLAQDDSLVVQQSVAFALVLGALIRGEPFDANISDKLMADVASGVVPFVAKSSIASADSGRASLGFASPDALLLPSWVAQAATDPEIRIQPAWKVSLIYGMSCAVNFVLPGAYYLAVRFSGDFESAVLHAINGGGQNMSRACLTGALVGAQVGLSGIPARFIEGLSHGTKIKRLAREVAERLVMEPNLQSN